MGRTCTLPLVPDAPHSHLIWGVLLTDIICLAPAALESAALIYIFFVTWCIQSTILCGHLAQSINFDLYCIYWLHGSHWTSEFAEPVTYTRGHLDGFKNFFLTLKYNAVIHIRVEICARLLIIFAHHCKTRIIVHNLRTLFPQDKLRVCIFKVSDNQSTKYYQKVGPIFISIRKM